MTENDDWGKTPTSVLFGRLILGVEYLINRRASVQFGKLLLFIYLVLAYIYILWLFANSLKHRYSLYYFYVPTVFTSSSKGVLHQYGFNIICIYPYFVQGRARSIYNWAVWQEWYHGLTENCRETSPIEWGCRTPNWCKYFFSISISIRRKMSSNVGGGKYLSRPPYIID